MKSSKNCEHYGPGSLAERSVGWRGVGKTTFGRKLIGSPGGFSCDAWTADFAWKRGFLQQSRSTTSMEEYRGPSFLSWKRSNDGIQHLQAHSTCAALRRGEEMVTEIRTEISRDFKAQGRCWNKSVRLKGFRKGCHGSRSVLLVSGEWLQIFRPSDQSPSGAYPLGAASCPSIAPGCSCQPTLSTRPSPDGW